MHIKTSSVNWLVILGIVLSAGCLVPEKFTADSVLNKDKSYSFTFKGTMVYLPYRMEQAEGRKESSDRLAAREAEMAAEIEKELLTKEGDTFKKVRYAGNGVFDIEYSTAGVLTQTYFFPGHDAQIIRFVPEKNGTITVQGSGEDKNWAEMEQLGVKVKGVFSLKTDAEVLEHNAGKTPGLFSRAYVWNIGPGNPPPHMILKSNE